MSGHQQRRGHVRNDNPARQQLPPQKISFIERIDSRWRIPGGTFLVEQRGAGKPRKIQRGLAGTPDHSVSSVHRTIRDYFADSVSWRLWRVYLVERQIECVAISVGEKLVVHGAALHRNDRVHLYWLAFVYRTVFDRRTFHLRYRLE